MRKATALVCRRLLRDKLPGGRAAYGKQILVTVSQELTAESGAVFYAPTPARMAGFVGGMPLAIEHLQGGWAAFGKQILVTVSRALTADHRRGFNYAEVARMTDGREGGLAGGQA